MGKFKLVLVDYLLVVHLWSNDVFFDEEPPDAVSECLKAQFPVDVADIYRERELVFWAHSFENSVCCD